MAEVVEQMRLQVADKIGKLAEVTGALVEAGVNIVAACAWTEGDKGQMLMVTDDNAKACEAVKDHVESCETISAVTVTLPDEVGTLNGTAARLAEVGIQINMAYATTAGGEARVVLCTSDDQQAASIL